MEKWFVIKTESFDTFIWQGILALLFFLSFLSWIFYAFISPPVFSKFNAKKFANEVYKCVLKANESELNIISDELCRSFKNIISISYTNAERSALDGKLNDKDPRVIAYELLILFADKKFCKSVISSCPNTAIEFLDQVKIQNKYDLPIGDFIINLSTEAINDSKSLLHSESDSSYFGILGHVKRLSNALYGNQTLTSNLGKHWSSPMDIRYEQYQNWTAQNWIIYYKAVSICFKTSIESTKATTPELYRAAERVKHSVFDAYKLDGQSDAFYLSESYLKLEGVIKLIEEMSDTLEKFKNQVPYKLRVPLNFRNNDPYDYIALIAMELIITASSIKGPPWTVWSIHRNLIWVALFDDLKTNDAKEIIRFKLKRHLCNQLAELNKSFRNYQAARIIGLCLNIMGLKILKDHFGKDYRALHRLIIWWIKRNYLQLQQNLPDVAEAMLVGNLNFDKSKNQLIRVDMHDPQKVIQTLQL